MAVHLGNFGGCWSHAKPRSREVAKGNAQVRCSVFGGRAADGSPRVLRVAAEAISAFNFLQSTLYGMDAIATDSHGFSRVIAIAVLNHE